MGNHEFCSRCHASDFHIGYTCEQAYPEKLARVEKERADRKVDEEDMRKRCRVLVEGLRRINIPAEFKEETISEGFHHIQVVIEGHNLIGNRRKAMADTDLKVQARRSKALERKYGGLW